MAFIKKKKRIKGGKFRCVCVGVVFIITVHLMSGCSMKQQEAMTANTVVMDTLVTQTAYGEGAEDAMREVNVALAEMEGRLSLFLSESEIALVNASAGQGPVVVSDETAQIVEQTLALSAKSEGAFAVSIAPLTTAWNITGDTPRVLEQDEVEELLLHVDDTAVHVQGNEIELQSQGMGIDLGGVAKGAACTVAQNIYAGHEVDSALLFLGGNIYARGTKPDGSAWRIGFRDPEGGENSYIASLPLQDAVLAVSGGYERYFEEDGVQYIHIIDPRTGTPVESDLLTVGVVQEDGLQADFWSTTLFVQGVEGALAYMQDGGRAIALDKEGNLYVSAALEEGFSLQTPGSHTVQFIEVEQ